MRKTSVRELHIHTSELVREAADGGIIVIERRGEPVAELHPYASARGLSPKGKVALFKSMEAFWSRMKPVNSSPIVEDDRSR